MWRSNQERWYATYGKLPHGSVVFARFPAVSERESRRTGARGCLTSPNCRRRPHRHPRLPRRLRRLRRGAAPPREGHQRRRQGRQDRHHPRAERLGQEARPARLQPRRRLGLGLELGLGPGFGLGPRSASTRSSSRGRKCAPQASTRVPTGRPATTRARVARRPNSRRVPRGCEPVRAGTALAWHGAYARGAGFSFGRSAARVRRVRCGSRSGGRAGMRSSVRSTRASRGASGSRAR